MAQVVAIILAVGSVLPLLTAVVEQPHWSPRTRTIIGVALSIVAGLATYVAQFGLNLDSPAAIVATVAGVVLAAAAAYKGIWKSSGVAPRIEYATSKKRPTGV